MKRAILEREEDNCKRLKEVESESETSTNNTAQPAAVIEDNAAPQQQGYQTTSLAALIPGAPNTSLMLPLVSNNGSINEVSRALVKTAGRDRRNFSHELFNNVVFIGNDTVPPPTVASAAASRIQQQTGEVAVATQVALPAISATHDSGAMPVYIQHMHRQPGQEQQAQVQQAQPQAQQVQQKKEKPSRSAHSGQCRGKSKKSEAGYLGVHGHSCKFRSRIYYKGKQHYLGVYKTKEEAAAAYDKAAREHRGNNPDTNFPSQEIADQKVAEAVAVYEKAHVEVSNSFLQ